jgi:hypothetical protein
MHEARRTSVRQGEATRINRASHGFACDGVSKLGKTGAIIDSMLAIAAITGVRIVGSTL